MKNEYDIDNLNPRSNQYLDGLGGVNEHQYLWTSEMGQWVLVKSERGYIIVNKLKKTMLLVEDEVLKGALATKCSQRTVKSMTIFSMLMRMHDAHLEILLTK